MPAKMREVDPGLQLSLQEQIDDIVEGFNDGTLLEKWGNALKKEMLNDRIDGELLERWDNAFRKEMEGNEKIISEKHNDDVRIEPNRYSFRNNNLMGFTSTGDEPHHQIPMKAPGLSDEDILTFILNPLLEEEPQILSEYITGSVHNLSLSPHNDGSEIKFVNGSDFGNNSLMSVTPKLYEPHNHIPMKAPGLTNEDIIRHILNPLLEETPDKIEYIDFDGKIIPAEYDKDMSSEEIASILSGPLKDITAINQLDRLTNSRQESNPTFEYLIKSVMEGAEPDLDHKYIMSDGFMPMQESNPFITMDRPELNPAYLSAIKDLDKLTNLTTNSNPNLEDIFMNMDIGGPNMLRSHMQGLNEDMPCSELKRELFNDIKELAEMYGLLENLTQFNEPDLSNVLSENPQYEFGPMHTDETLGIVLSIINKLENKEDPMEQFLSIGKELEDNHHKMDKILHFMNDVVNDEELIEGFSYERPIHDPNQITSPDQLEEGEAYVNIRSHINIRDPGHREIFRITQLPNENGIFKISESGGLNERAASLSDNGITSYPSGLWNAHNYVILLEDGFGKDALELNEDYQNIAKLSREIDQIEKPEELKYLNKELDGLDRKLFSRIVGKEKWVVNKLDAERLYGELDIIEQYAKTDSERELIWHMFKPQIRNDFQASLDLIAKGDPRFFGGAQIQAEIDLHNFGKNGIKVSGFLDNNAYERALDVGAPIFEARTSSTI